MNDELLERLVIALERIADAHQRIAAANDAQAENNRVAASSGAKIAQQWEVYNKLTKMFVERKAEEDK